MTPSRAMMPSVMRASACLAALLLWTLPTRAEPCRVAVLDLEAQGLPADEAHLARALSDALASAVADASGCAVLTRADIASMADFEAGRQACGVDSPSCFAELGSALGVERLVTGAVARIGTSTTVSARLLDLKSGAVVARAEETTTDVAALRPLTLKVGQRLLGLNNAVDGGPGPLLIAGVVTVGVGVLGLVGGALLALPADATLGTVDASRVEKDNARTLGTAGLVVGGVAGGVVVVGAALATLGMME
jgi:TolB-like protein